MKVSRTVTWAAALVALIVLAASGWWLGMRTTDTAAAPPGAALAEERLDLVLASGTTKTLTVEIARTPEQQAKGLMFRNHLADDRGMLFPHAPPRDVSMWMRNTYFPLDMVFIKSDGTVHRIAARTEPLSEKIISSEGEVSAVLELAGGAAERYGLKPGDIVRHPLFTR
jgi:uncharacterized membrane protein (UPF0127 family)